MNHLTELIQFSLAIIATTIFLACSPAYEKAQQSDFFTPVDRMTHKKSAPDSLVVYPASTATATQDGLKDSLLVLFRQQNSRLSEMVQQLNLLTKKNDIPPAKDSEYFEEVISDTDHISNEILLEKIRDQNLRLNNVVEQLKRYSQNQQAQDQNHYPLVSGATEVPVLVTGANSVPAKPSPLKKNTGTQPPLSSISYGKAIELYKSQRITQAMEIFHKLLDRKIEMHLADRYHFWLGVCQLSMKRTDQALTEFNEVLGFTNSEKGEEAYFMIGQCYEQKGAKSSAKTVYEKMLQLYPKGSLKQIAEKKLAILK
jgi:TolA-binding protein